MRVTDNTKKWLYTTLVVSFFLVSCTMLGPIMSDVEQPIYDVLSTFENGKIQIRQYKPMIIAEVKVRGERNEAIGDGFRLLADYIFGNKTVMKKATTPESAPQPANKKIAMTAPVQQQANDNQWSVSFVMPAEYHLETLPQPNNKAVKLRLVPEKRFVAIQFSGGNSESTISKHEKQLARSVDVNQLQILGPPKYAFYNPPWTLPFLRRNEIMFEIQERE